MTLVRNEVDRCLREAGDGLHDRPDPRNPRGYTHAGSTFTGAQYHMLRVQLLDRLGVTAAAAYLRQELLDAIAAQKEQDETVKRLTVKRTTGHLMADPSLSADPMWGVRIQPRAVLEDMVAAYQRYEMINRQMYDTLNPP